MAFNDRINYQLDGSSNVESDRAGIRPASYLETWIQEVQAVNNGFAPEFGNTVGTLFNAITRRARMSCTAKRRTCFGELR